MAGGHHHHSTHICEVCGLKKDDRQMVPGITVRHNIQDMIAKAKPDWKQDGFTCISCLNRFRTEYARSQMEAERGELSALEQEVIKSLHANESVVEDMNAEFDKNLSFGDRLADQVAAVGGSWGFVIGFGLVLTIWVVINTVILMSKAFDPYPFILLNLFLSMLAAIQAPIIMMSQNRSAVRDRIQAESDFKVNLKAEIEVRALTEKIDQLLHNQWMRLMEIQQIQMEMLEDLTARRGQ
ncbi:MAG TPA: DUF1003 domain-containing protein [Rhizomicrobium sp.]|jgi:uncharacterized membrane protein